MFAILMFLEQTLTFYGYPDSVSDYPLLVRADSGIDFGMRKAERNLKEI